MTQITYDKINAACLAKSLVLVRSWLPGGLLDGDKYQPMVAGKGKFTIDLTTGQWHDEAAGEQGSDLIGLYAHTHAMTVGDAAKKVAIAVGMDLGETKPTAGRQANAPARKQDAHWSYHSADGEKAFQVWCWHGAKRSEEITLTMSPVLVEGKYQLAARRPPGLLPVYDFHLLGNATNKELPVLVVSNEKTVDRARALLGETPTMFVTTWAGGTNAVKKTDWACLKGRSVLILPDNSVATKKMASGVAKMCELHAAGVMVILPAFAGKAKGWGVRDWDDIDGDLNVWLAENISTRSYSPLNYERKLREGKFDSSDTDPAQVRHSPEIPNLPVRCLGHSGSNGSGFLKYYLLSHSTGVLLTPTVNQITDAGLLQLADPDIWAEIAPKGKGGGVDWVACRQLLVAACNKSGVFDLVRSFRGRGVWMGKGEKVAIHAGNKMWYDGSWRSPTEHPDFVMAHTASIDLGPEPVPAKIEELRQVQTAIHSLRWRSSWMPKFLHGWMLAAPFSGLLQWRTHCVLSGASGVGKTTTARMLADLCLGDLVLSFEGGTEAGIRRTIAMEGLPVRVDENERRGRSDAAMSSIKEIMHLARIASSDSNAVIIHGDGNAYRPRSMFLFNFIDPSMEEESSKNRFVVCELERALSKEWSHFDDFNRRVEDVAAGYYRRAFWWVYQNLDAWSQSTAIFKDVYREKGNTPRTTEAHAAIFALACLSSLGKVPSYEQAVNFTGDASDADEHEVVADEEQILDHLLHYAHRFPRSHGGMHEMRISDMIKEVHQGLASSDVDMSLTNFGIRVVRGEVRLLYNGDGINRMFTKSMWGPGWRATMERLSYAARGKSPMKDGNKKATRYIGIPVAACLINEDEV